MPRKAIQAHLQIPYRKINYFNGTLTNLKWTCGSMWKKKKNISNPMDDPIQSIHPISDFAISDLIHPIHSAGSVNL